MNYVDACTCKAWTIGTWTKEGEAPSFFPYRCNSWRHEGPCRDRCGAVDFARVMAAIESRQHWTYLVFTFPQSTKRLDKEAFTSGCRKWSAMRKRIIHRFGQIKYIQTWEVHKSGWPHVNCLVSNEALYEQAVASYKKLRRSFFIPANVQIGFGRRIWVEAMKNGRHLGGYLTKLGLELIGGEHKGQIPVMAPKHFRRIRASVGLLPKRFKDENKTGQLFKMEYDFIKDAFDRNIQPMERLTHITETPTGGTVANNEGWKL